MSLNENILKHQNASEFAIKVSIKRDPSTIGFLISLPSYE